MKLTFQRIPFQNAFLIASAVTASRSPKDVLTNVKLDATSDRATLMATDMEAGIRIDLSGVEIETPGKALLPVIRIGNILRETSDERLSIAADDKSLDIHGLQSEFHLPNINPDTFPTVAPFEEESYFEVEARLFRELVKRTIFATDTESTRYALGGVLLDMSDDRIVAVATDGRRLAKMEGKGQPVGGFQASGGNTIVPVKTLSLMEKSLQDSDQVVHIAVRQNDILVRTGRCMIYSRLVEGRYPNWRQVIPNRSNNHRLTSLAGPFHTAVRQASIVADQESRGVNFDFSTGNVVMQATTAEVGESRVELPVSYDGPEIKMTMSGQYVGDFFRVLETDKNFNIDISSGEEPALFSTDDGYLNVIMPMARDR
jgi:DNA polymerase III subunit beta